MGFSVGDIAYHIHNMKNDNIHIENIKNLFNDELNSDKYNEYFDPNIDRFDFLYNDIIVDIY